MASSKLQTAPCSSGTKLPSDVLFEVLLCLPAKELCHLRIVCRSWHALTTDPLFIKAHASRHKDPLFAVTFWNGKNNWGRDTIYGISIMDMSGNVLKQIAISKAFDSISVLPMCLDLICIGLPGKSIRVLNPATEECELVPSWQYNHAEMTHAFGLVASTGQYKMVRIVHLDLDFHDPSMHPCEVMTLDKSNHRTWRRKQCALVVVSPGHSLRRRGFMKNVVLHGIVYFMMDAGTTEPAGIVPFNLETEEWMPTIRGPESLQSLVGDEQLYPSYFELNCDLSVANLSSCLVTVHNVNVHDFSIDLWFLMDADSGMWVKKYSVSIQHDDLYFHEAYPLLVLDDGRIVFYEPLDAFHRYDPETGTCKPQMDLLQIYDPETSTYTNMWEIKNGNSSGVGIYTGSPLGFENGSC